MASVQRIRSPLTGDIAYRAQIRVRGRRSESATFPNKKEAEAWAALIETAIRENRHFPHAAAKRTSFDALCQDYVATVLADARESTRGARTEQLKWWAARFSGKTLAEITPDAVAAGRDALAAETFTRGKEHTDKHGNVIMPKQYKRTGATVNRYLAALSHMFSFAVKERRILDRNPVADIAKKKEARGRTRFLTDAERTALLDACGKSEWQPLYTLVLLAITSGARRGELLTLRWADVDLKAGRALVRETKNGEQRTLPLAGKALETLRELKLQGSARSQYVFPAPNGRDEPAKHIDAYWYAALDAAGISDFHFHDLRHYLPSLTMSGGALRA